MGKALVIKGADFNTNKLGTVTFTEPIPCTSITLSQNTITVTNVGDTVTLTATVLPVDTTDTVIWTSSNTNVASVDDGVVTVKGIGTATITAKCGRRVATATVNQTSLRFTDIVTADNYRANNSGGMMSLYSTNASTCIGKAYSNTDSLRIYHGATNGMEAIPVPYGATSVTIISSERKYWSYLYLGDMDELTTYSGNNYAKYIKNYSSFYTDSPKAVEYGQCIIFSAASAIAAFASGLLFQ